MYWKNSLGHRAYKEARSRSAGRRGAAAAGRLHAASQRIQLETGIRFWRRCYARWPGEGDSQVMIQSVLTPFLSFSLPSSRLNRASRGCGGGASFAPHSHNYYGEGSRGQESPFIRKNPRCLARVLECECCCACVWGYRRRPWKRDRYRYRILFIRVNVMVIITRNK